MRKEDRSIIVEQTYNASLDDAWSAITEIDQMRQWYFDNIPAFRPEIGFETQFNVQSGGRDFLHLWKVTEVVSKKRITYNWKYDGYPGDSFVVFELSQQDNLTTLRLTHQVTESFPEDIPDFNREGCIEGWKYFIKNSLKKYLEGGK